MINRENLISGTRPKIVGKVLTTTSDHFDGYQIVQYNGLVWGISIRAKDIGTDFLMSCKQTIGGELTSFTELADEGRQRAIDRMMEMSYRLGINAIINFRFHNENVMGLTEVTAYGTGVIIEPIQDYVPVGAIGNILADMADFNFSNGHSKTEVKSSPQVAAPKTYPIASLKIIGDKFLISCPECKNIYNTTRVSEKVLEVKGYQDADTKTEGQQIKCDNCGTVFSLPTIEAE
jgi:uncharacterized protein YbjQ (UPF0145 family)